MQYYISNIQANFSNWYLGYLLCHGPHVNVTVLPDDKSILDQVMAWCHQAPEPMLSQLYIAILPLGHIYMTWKFQ